MTCAPTAGMLEAHALAEEDRAPAWTYLVPFAYLAACGACIRAVALDPTTNFGVAALLVAVGLIAVFAVPAIFSSRSVRLGASERGLVVDGRATKLVEARIEEGQRGAAFVHVMTATGARRSFRLASRKEADKLLANLPPVSAPVGALEA